MQSREYDIKAKPTLYNGVEFRSRLEARWAVFFDSLRIRWEYEETYFETEYGYYKPDFWLDTGWIIEIKPTTPLDIEFNKVESVNGKIALISGSPSPMAQLWLFNNGKMMDIQLSDLEQFHCFIKGYSMWQWLSMKKLKKITGKYKLWNAFKVAERMKF